ncbi:MAG: sulfatase-like hydrolase/transferase [Oceanobacter sp.]
MADSPQKNILFLMMDQLRWDCLSCYGHPVVETPNIDRLASKGVRFTNAYTQGSSCGNSRASYYTGRHVRSHGATWNTHPFHLAEWTLADYLKPAGCKTVLMGKTHMKPDLEGMARLGIDLNSVQARSLLNAGFVLGEHDDGLYPEGPDGQYSPVMPAYNDYLKAQGFNGLNGKDGNGWFEWANAVEDDNGDVHSGFYIQYANRPARIPKEHSETAYMTDRAIEEITNLGDQSWCLHLSYIKPHWPYVAPSPYHALYQGADLPPMVQSAAEQVNPHPVYKAFMEMPICQNMTKQAYRDQAMVAYLGLIKELDDNIGRLLVHLDNTGQADNTLIVLTSDHGDYFGDHWLAEKDLFHDQSVKVPMIILDPSEAANSTRGTTSDHLVCAIDLLPTFVEYAANEGAPEIPYHRLEGRSLLSILHGEPQRDRVLSNRNFIVSEGDYARLPVAAKVSRDMYDARMTMGFDGRYKLIHFPGMPSMLFDLANDPQELFDLGRDPGYALIRAQLMEQMLDWSATLKNRTTVSESRFHATHSKSFRRGIIPGFWNEEDIAAERRIPVLGSTRC